MSARATAQGRLRAAEFFPTPRWAIDRILDVLDGGAVDRSGRFLEPSAGEGAIIKAAREMWLASNWTAVEIRDECRGALLSAGSADTICGSFFEVSLDMFGGERFGLCLGNPPFSLAQAFIEHALTMSREVVFLLRLAFLESRKRRPFFEKYGVPDLYVLPERPSFTGDGKTDGAAYAWMRWNWVGSHSGRTRILYGDDRQGQLLASPEAKR